MQLKLGTNNISTPTFKAELGGFYEEIIKLFRIEILKFIFISRPVPNKPAETMVETKQIFTGIFCLHDLIQEELNVSYDLPYMAPEEQ